VNPIEAEAARALAQNAHRFGDWFEDHLRHHQTPATMPAATKENRMSLATLEDDFRNGLSAVKNEIGRFESNLPAMVAEAKTIASSPLGQLAITGAEHVAAGILPPEALAVIESGAAKLFGDILSLYNPQGAAVPAAPAQA
jgi:hypothetical protein